MLKVGIISLYYGALPSYFPIWLKSCGYNSSIDFLLFSDSNLEEYMIPSNVKVIKMPLRDFKSLAEMKLNMRISLERPYKLCDFRPAYGFILEEYLKSYDYWGHCDIDVVWGDLRHFFEQFCLEYYDKFLDRGHLTLYRNTQENNKAFLQKNNSLSFKKVFSSDKNCFFDETGANLIFKNLRKPVFSTCIYADINLFYEDFRHADHEKRPANYKEQLFYWENGHIFQAYVQQNQIYKKEWLYVHFQKRCMPEPKFSVEKCNQILITKMGFIPYKSEITRETIMKYNKRDNYYRNLKRREYVYCGKSDLTRKEFIKYILIRSYSILCNSRLWKWSIGKIWIKIRT